MKEHLPRSDPTSMGRPRVRWRVLSASRSCSHMDRRGCAMPALPRGPLYTDGLFRVKEKPRLHTRACPHARAGRAAGTQEETMQRVTRVLAAATLAAFFAAPTARVQAQTAAAPAGFKAQIIRAIEAAEKHLIALAERVPPEKYGWHPEGARTFSEVFMHIAAGNYGYATLMGTPRPEGMTSANLSKITDKEQVVTNLKNSFAHIKAAVQN